MSNLFQDKRKLFGTILGIIMFALTIISITYAYYSWKSSETTVTFNIDDDIFYCETDVDSSVGTNSDNVLAPVNNYRNGVRQSFIVKNIGRQNTTFSLTMNVTNISSDIIKHPTFKYKLVYDPTGGARNCTLADATSDGAGNTCINVTNGTGDFSNIQLGMNTLVQSITLPNNSKYKYYFFMYLDGQGGQTPDGIQNESMSATLGVCDIYVPLIASCHATVSPTHLKVTNGATYGDAYSYDNPNTVVGLPNPTPINTVVSYNSNASGVSNPASQTISYSITANNIWYENDSFTGSPVTNSTVVTTTENKTLYAKITPSPVNATVTLPSISRSTYTFLGWYTQATGGTRVGGIGGSYVPGCEKTPTLYAHWMSNNYYNVDTGVYYETLKDAFDAVTSNQTIRVDKSVTETIQPTLESGKTGVKLNMNGNTTTLNGVYIDNSGTLDIYSSVNGGILQGNSTRVVYNNGTLTTNGTSSSYTLTIRNTSTNYNDTYVIYNKVNKSVTLNGNTTVTYNNGTTNIRYLIYTESTLNINGATLTNSVSTVATNDRGIALMNYAAQVVINSGSVSAGGIGIYNGSSGTITVSGGSVSGQEGIYNGSGTVTISGSSTTITGTSGYGIDGGSGTVSISGGTITGTNSAVIGSGISSIAVTVTGGNINSTSGVGILNDSVGTVNMSGGSINAAIGIKNNSSGAIVIRGSSTTITGTSGYGIDGHTGDVTVSNGTVTGSTSGIYTTTGNVTVEGGSIIGTNEYGIYNSAASGTITVSGGSVRGTNGIYNNAAGTIEVSGSSTTITGTSGYGIRGYTGNVTVSNGTVTGSTSGIYITTGKATVTGGTVIGSTLHGIHVTSTGTVTLGENSGTPSTSTPIIRSNATSGSTYGIYMANSGGILNFYDGVVKSNRRNGSINRENVNINRPTGYYVVKKNDTSSEDAYLSNQAYTLTFNSNGGDATVVNGTGSVGVVVNSHVLYPNTITLPTRTVSVQYDMGTTGITQVPQPSPLSTTLAGWYLAAGGNDKLLTGATTPVLQPSVGVYTDSNANWIGTSNTTVYAHWQGASITLASLSQTGYTCKWRRNTNNSLYNPGASVSDISANTTFTAECTANIYTITLDKQNCANGTVAGTTYIYEKYDDGYYLDSAASSNKKMSTSANPITIPQKTGYTFGGYYTATNGGGVQYIAASGKLTSSASATQFSANGTLYASCPANTYTLTFNGNGATTNGTGSVTVTYDSSALSPSSITLPKKKYNITFDMGDTGVTNPGAMDYTYSLLGWNTGSNHSDTKLLNNSTTPSLVANVTNYTGAGGIWRRDDGATVYADWNDNGITLPALSKGQYFTCKWHKSSTTGQEYSPGATVTGITANTVFYAVCDRVTYSVTVYYNSNPTSGQFTQASVVLSCQADDNGTCTVDTTNSTTAWNTIKNSVSFYKCIIDYTYPEFTVEKNKMLNKSLYKNLLTSKPYYLKIDKQIQNYEKNKLNYLQQSFKIKKLNIKNK